MEEREKTIGGPPLSILLRLDYATIEVRQRSYRALLQPGVFTRMLHKVPPAVM
jgi:hypothetical protein